MDFTRLNNLCKKASNKYLEIISSNACRAISYAFVQTSIATIINHASITYYGLDTYEERDAITRFSLQAGTAILASFGAYAAIQFGRHIQGQEKAAFWSQGPNQEHKFKIDLDNCGLLAKWYPRIFSMQVYFVTGLELYAYAMRPFIPDDNHALEIVLLTAFGLSASALGGTFQTVKNLERGEAKLLLFKKEPDNELAKPESIKKQHWVRFLRPLKYGAFIAPAIRMSSMLALTINETLSTPEEINQEKMLGLYIELFGVLAGIMNLAAFLKLPNYQGQINKITMNFLLYSMYIYIGISAKIANIASEAGNKSMANDIYLDGWIFLAISLALIFAPSIAYDHQRLNILFQQEIKQHRKEKINRARIEEQATPIEINSTTQEYTPISKISLKNSISHKKRGCFSFFKKKNRNPETSENHEGIELQENTNMEKNEYDKFTKEFEEPLLGKPR